MQVKQSLKRLVRCTVVGTLVAGLGGIVVPLVLRFASGNVRADFEIVKDITAARLALLKVGLNAMDCIVDKDNGAISSERMDIFANNKEKLRSSIKTLKGALHDKDDMASLETIERKTARLFNIIDGDLKTALVQRADQEVFASLDDSIDGAVEEIGEIYNTLSSRIIDDFRGVTSWMLTLSLFGIIGSLILIGLVSVIAISISKASGAAINTVFVSLTSAIESIKAGNFKTSVPYLASSGEVGNIARAIEDFRRSSEDRHEDGIRKAREQEQLLEKQRRLECAIQSFEAVVGVKLGTVSGAGTKLVSTADNVTVIIEDAVREPSGISLAASEILQNVQGIAAASEEMQVASRVIAGQLNNSNTVLSKVVDQNSDATKSAERLKEVVESVQGVVTFIEGIATQINLLALNASIESARAGEAGKGFAVVASEVKGLASQVATATGDISAKIGSIQQSSGEVIQAIRLVEDSIKQLSATSEEIEHSLGEQNQAIAEVSRSMSVAVTGVGQITGSVGSIGQATSKTQEGCNEFSVAAGVLRAESDELGKVVSKFLGQLAAESGNKSAAYH